MLVGILRRHAHVEAGRRNPVAPAVRPRLCRQQRTMREIGGCLDRLRGEIVRRTNRADPLVDQILDDHVFRRFDHIVTDRDADLVPHEIDPVVVHVELQFGIGMACVKPADARDEPRHHDRRGARERQRARLQLLDARIDQCEGAGQVLREPRAFRRRLHRASAARQQRDAEHVLEALDMAADSAMRHRELLGRRRHAAEADGRFERPQRVERRPPDGLRAARRL